MCLVDSAVFVERHDTQCLKETRTRILQVRDTTPVLRGASQWLKLQNPAKAGALILVVAVICLQLCQPNSRSATCGRAPGRQTIHTDPRGCQTPSSSHTPTHHIPAVKSLFIRFGLSVLTRTLTSVQPLLSTPNRIGHYWPNFCPISHASQYRNDCQSFLGSALPVLDTPYLANAPPRSMLCHRYAYPDFLVSAPRDSKAGDLPDTTHPRYRLAS